ncbi:MAG: HesA/MoeB/ThiF family protein [Granulosicoccaceae bacterium]
MNDDQLLRYSRHINLPAIGFEGQQALLDSHVVIVGAGGLGSPAALYLAAAGVGELTLIDFDTVDVSNLQRQVAHTTASVGQPKVDSARINCLEINPDIKINARNTALNADNASELFSGATVVVDASDNFSVRFAVNDACVALGLPLVSAAAIRLEGQLSVFRNDRDDSPCYRCLHPAAHDQGDTCSQSGVLGPVVGVMGTLQALETIKVITGNGEDMAGQLLLFDASSCEWTKLRLPKRADCPVCSPQSKRTTN